MHPAFLSPTPFPRLSRPPLRPTCPRRPPHMTSSKPPPQPSAPPTQSSPKQKPPPVTFTFLENNTFTLSTPSTTLLIDPWLTGDLVFLTPAFFRGVKPEPARRPISNLDIATVDLVVLTQALPDHAHPPTLEKLPKHIPILAPPSALPLLRSLNFQNIHIANHGDVLRPLPDIHHLQLTIAKGSIVGPPWSDPQLAVIFEFADENHSQAITRVYHEPHGNHQQQVLDHFKGKLDAVIVPVVETTIPTLGNYALVNGIPQALQLCEATLPPTCVTFDNSGGEQTGFLTKYLRKKGGREEFAKRVRENEQLRDMRILNANAGEPILIAVDETQ